LHDNESFAYAAFRAYRNYDGAAASFGDVSLEATSSDVAKVTVYGSVHAADPNKVVLIAINKDSADSVVALQLAHPTKYASVGRYELKAANAGLSMQSDVASSADNAWKLTLPAQSVTVLVPKR
jgi:O-glycosyl hydrolase